MRMLIVSNRLPFTVSINNNELSFRQSGGGLVSGLSSYLDSLKGSIYAPIPSPELEHIWVGWPGITIDDEWKERVQSVASNESSAHAVFLAEAAMENFYHGFCNKTIWPLFHYFPEYCVYDEDYWQQYQDVNRIFCDAVMDVAKPDDIIWVHDYHLLLLPAMLRKRAPQNRIGFFLHIPFPSFEIYRLIPGRWRSQILEGILGADVIGFHTRSYTDYFLECVQRFLAYEVKEGEISLDDRVAFAGTFPMGIDFKKYRTAAVSPEAKEEKEKLQKGLGECKTILSVDRLDYTKGIINRLKGYEIFLEKNPDWRNRVILILIVVPSRIGVEHYSELKRQIDEAAGRINGKFGTVSWTPILYQYRFQALSALAAFYSVSDVALITPLRDGMNLIAKEYLASRVEGTGVLVLSEMAGASSELYQAIVINPNDIPEIVGVIRRALEMPEQEQILRNEPMQRRLQEYDVVRWATEFLQKLQDLSQRRQTAKS